MDAKIYIYIYKYFAPRWRGGWVKPPFNPLQSPLYRWGLKVVSPPCEFENLLMVHKEDLIGNRNYFSSLL